MRIAFLVNRDIESVLALNMLLPGLSKHELSVFVSQQVGSAKSAPQVGCGAAYHVVCQVSAAAGAVMKAKAAVAMKCFMLVSRKRKPHAHPFDL